MSALSPTGQPMRLLAYLRAHPGATPMQLVTELRIPKYTARASDLRAAGYVVDVTTDPDGTTHYFVREPAPKFSPVRGEQLTFMEGVR